MFIAGLGTANPPHRYTQAECLSALQAHPCHAALKPASQALIARILQHPHGITTRHFALDDLSQAFELVPDAMQRRFADNAPQLATDAALRALDNAELTVGDIDAVVISTCTGYLCPGLTSYVIERLGLRPDTLALDLVGQGCGAAIPNLRTSEALIAAGQAQHVLSVCVEVCSAAMYLDDDAGVLVSACLFGDGSGAAILSAEPGNGLQVEWLDSHALTYPEDRDLLRFEHRHGLLRNILSPQVPQRAAHYAEAVLTPMLQKHGLAQSDIAGWVWHGGGKNVLDTLQAKLGLDDIAVRHSRRILNDYGNLSSAFAYFVLQAALADRSQPGWWWMSSFGAGFSCHGALLKVTA
jgi:alkylresorcinol/alkylpyrone synthase